MSGSCPPSESDVVANGERIGVQGITVPALRTPLPVPSNLNARAWDLDGPYLGRKRLLDFVVNAGENLFLLVDSLHGLQAIHDDLYKLRLLNRRVLDTCFLVAYRDSGVGFCERWTSAGLAKLTRPAALVI